MTRGEMEPAGQLAPVLVATAGLREALSTGDLVGGRLRADELVARTSALLEAIHQDPHHDPGAGAERVAALRVYRNAAFAFRRLADSGSGEPPDPGLSAVCSALLAQGDDHLRLHDAPDSPDP